MFFNIKINLKTLKKAGCDAKTNIQLLINNNKKKMIYLRVLRESNFDVVFLAKLGYPLGSSMPRIESKWLWT